VAPTATATVAPTATATVAPTATATIAPTSTPSPTSTPTATVAPTNTLLLKEFGKIYNVDRPEFKGVAGSNTQLKISIDKANVETYVKTDEAGAWSYTVEKDLPSAEYNLVVEDLASGNAERTSFTVNKDGNSQLTMFESEKKQSNTMLVIAITVVITVLVMGCAIIVIRRLR
jgi:hypothetical protein